MTPEVPPTQVDKPLAELVVQEIPPHQRSHLNDERIAQMQMQAQQQ
ncbi:MAG: hypothetical protein WC444_03720 [Candidatus Paceibacterota bacterium]